MELHHASTSNNCIGCFGEPPKPTSGDFPNFIFGFGGGISNGNTLTVTNSTISGNSAGGGGIVNQFRMQGSRFQGFFFIIGTTTTTSSIFDNPRGGNIIGGQTISGGHNFFSDTPAVLLDPTDLVNTDPLLGPLADNGGPTFTQAQLPGSPAIDAGIAVAGVTTDQRGVPRPQGKAPDIGAFDSSRQRS